MLMFYVKGPQHVQSAVQHMLAAQQGLQSAQELQVNTHTIWPSYRRGPPKNVSDTYFACKMLCFLDLLPRTGCNS